MNVMRKNILFFLGLAMSVVCAAETQKPMSRASEQLMSCAWQGSVQELQALIDAGADVNAADNVGDTALMRAAQRGDAEMVKVLLAAGAAPNAQDKRGWTALMGACVSRNTPDTSIAKMLIDAGTQLELKNEHGFTALSYAAQSNKLAHVELLLAAGADVNSRDIMGRNVLHRAVMCRVALPMVRCLLSAGAEPKQKAPFLSEEDHLLYDAVYYQQSLEAVQLLIEAGADVNGAAVLCAAAYAKDSRVQSALLAAGADPNKGNPLSLVISKRLPLKRVRELIEAGADVNPAISAALHDADGMNYLKLLLENGADVNYRGKEGESPFMVAITHANQSAMTLLLEAGANPLAVNDAGKNALDLFTDIRCQGLTGIRKWEPPSKPNRPTMSEGTYTQLVRCLKTMEGIPAAERLSVWKSEMQKEVHLPPLVQAAAQGDAGRVAELLAAGADVNGASPYTGRTPLMVAADWLAADVLKLLLEGGADVNCRDYRGNTALMYAQTHPGLHGGNNSVFYGAEPDATSVCTEMLLGAGADVLARNDDGISALDMIENDYQKRNELLRKACREEVKK